MTASTRDITYFPHSICLRGDHALIMLHVCSDALIAFSYLVVPACAILLLMRVCHSERFRKFLFRNRWPVGVLPACFILACGASHGLNAMTYFYPVYWVEGWWKLLTGLISLATAGVLAALAFHHDDD